MIRKRRDVYDKLDQIQTLLTVLCWLLGFILIAVTCERCGPAARAAVCPSPDDPNFIAWLIDSEPNAQAECLDAWYPAETVIEQNLPPQYEPEPVVPNPAWVDVYSLQLRAFCEDWLTDKIVVYDREFPFDPGMADFWIGDIPKKLEGDGWIFNLTVTRYSKMDWRYRIVITRPRNPVNMNDFAVFSRNWRKSGAE